MLIHIWSLEALLGRNVDQGITYVVTRGAVWKEYE